MEWWSLYSLFAAKVGTFLLAIVVVLVMIARVRSAGRQRGGEATLNIKERKERFLPRQHQLNGVRMSDSEYKRWQKQQIKEEKARLKEEQSEQPVVWVLDFDGDLQASGTDEMAEEITSLIEGAHKGDEVVLRLESGGGLVHAYGLAAAQLDRLRDAGLKLTVCVDRVAASGGYMMACCADHLVAAPFAVIGSIGVVAQVPNVHRLLKKHDVDVEILTAGEHKRTLTMLGENTPEGRRKFLEDLADTHTLFKQHVQQRRPALDIHHVADGDIWYGQQAVALGLIDDVQTSEGYLAQRARDGVNIFELSLTAPQSLVSRLTHGAESALKRTVEACVQRALNWRSERT